jgi:hypothetical protein
MPSSEKKPIERKKKLIILLAIVVALFLHILSLYLSYSEFQQTRLMDPLAELHSLSLLYYIALALVAFTGIACLIWRVHNKFIHIILLLILANILWVTPWWITSFVRLPDAPWHVGIAMHISEVLSGVPAAFSNYGWSYPASYFYHNIIINSLDIPPLIYIYFYPFFCTLLFILFTYVIFSKLFSPAVALLALLLAIPGMHYIQLHASPHSFGALLMLLTLLLLTLPGIKSKVLCAVIILITAITHPSTPLLFCIFLFSAMAAWLVYNRKLSLVPVVLAIMLLLCLAGWVACYVFYPQSPVESQIGVSNPAIEASGIINSLTPGEMDVADLYIKGSPFIYENIYNLNRGIYFLYGLVSVVIIAIIFLTTYFSNRKIKDWLAGIGGLKTGETALLISLPLLLILSLLMGEIAHDLIETGLTYLVLVSSGFIAAVILRTNWINKKMVSIILTIGGLFLSATFPLVAYSIDAYSNFPLSEKKGIEFAADNIPMDKKNIAGNSLAQFALFLPDPAIKVTTYKLDLSAREADVVIYSSTGFYYEAMRFALSYQSNKYTRSLVIANGPQYNQVYSSSTMKIFIKNRTS